MFDQYYNRLNKAQKEAVDAIEGPVMVVAGPGTGKTQILTLRIANILKQSQIEPGNILALTFTVSGVASMRKRLAEIIGTPAYAVEINTFHGFCNNIIKSNPTEFPRIIGGQSITEVDQINIIQEAITELALKELKPWGDPLYFTRAILAGINDLKREGVHPVEFTKAIAKERERFATIPDLYHEKGPHKGKIKGDYQKLQKQIAKNDELNVVYDFYQQKLSERKLYDYGDMVMEVVREFQNNKDLLLQLQEQYQYILVDEHQDTNNAQNKVIELLCNFHADPNIFVVGDEKQAIFRFQGASLDNFLYFKKLYPSARLIVLKENYRSTQKILDAAHHVLAGEKELKANAGHQNINIRLGAFSGPETELFFAVEDIKNKIDSGIAPGDIAILYRDNRDALPLAHIFEKFGIPFSIESDQDIMADHDIRKLLLLFRAIADFGSDERLLEALHIDFLGIPPLEAYQIIFRANERRISPYSIIKSNLPDFYAKLSDWASLSHNIGLEELFEKIVRESGFLAAIMKKPDVFEKLGKLNGLFDELKSLVERDKDFKLSQFLTYVDTLRTHNILLKRSVAVSTGRVRLMTAHRSKGQEFDYVYIVLAYDGHWGNKRRPNLLPLINITGSSGTDNEDERRLFYVALTRAKKQATITYAASNHAGQDQLPTLFVNEIKPELIDNIDTEAVRQSFKDKQDILFAPAITIGPDIQSKELIRELFDKFGFSVTGLNNYLKCPWQYFYTNLLRIPKAKSKHQMYGTAVHNTLKDFFDGSKEKLLPVGFLLERFKTYVSKEPLQAKDLDESLAKGERSLRGYYEAYKDGWHRNTLSEFNIKGVQLTAEIRLTGKIDKIEIHDGNEVRVVDYKTSKPKTRGEIEGITKTSSGDIKRQLIFYKLLLDKFDPPVGGGRYKMAAGDIDFIEPDDKGRYHKETFAILDSEVQDLEKVIKTTCDEILNLKFWSRFCDDKDCEYCALRKMMS